MVNFYMMVGLPGSGKSFYAKNNIIPNENGECVYLSSGEYRQKLLGDVNDQTKNALVFQTLQSDAVEALKNGKSVVYDATNVTLKNRATILKAINGIACHKVAVVINTPVEVCIERDKNRERTVGEYVIHKFERQYQFPQKFEGFDEIWIGKYHERDWIEQDMELYLSTRRLMNSFEQKNPHHLYTVGKHCLYLALQYDKDVVDFCGFIAGLFHDVGKLFTQSFDEDGVAHYYNHDSVGTYYIVSHIEILPTARWDDVFEILFYINYHMRAHRDFKSPKAERKYRRIFGDDRYERLMQFGEYDRIASGTYIKDTTDNSKNL